MPWLRGARSGSGSELVGRWLGRQRTPAPAARRVGFAAAIANRRRDGVMSRGPLPQAARVAGERHSWTRGVRLQVIGSPTAHARQRVVETRQPARTRAAAQPPRTSHVDRPESAGTDVQEYSVFGFAADIFLLREGAAKRARDSTERSSRVEAERRPRLRSVKVYRFGAGRSSRATADTTRGRASAARTPVPYRTRSA